MKKSRLFGYLCAVLFSIISMSANAELHGRLPLTPGGTDYQAAYDDVLGIAWVTNATLSGPNTWDNQVAWASNLEYLGFDDWRLASMSVSAGLPTGTTPSAVNCTSATELACRDNELGYMQSYNMGETGFSKVGTHTIGDVTLTDIQSVYWSGTGFSSSEAWDLLFEWASMPTHHDSSSSSVYDSFGWAVRDGDVGVPVGIITIDIKPGSDPVNPVNSKSKGVIPVAVLGSMDFDATQVDFSTIEFGPGKASPVHDGHIENVNGDGFEDMVFHFKTQSTGITCGDTAATLTGETFGGDAFTGTDSVKTVGCKAVIVVPTGLNPGDTYHLVFVSSTTLKAKSSSIIKYDAHVQAAADAAGVGVTEGVTWYAIGSTPTVNAIDHGPLGSFTAPVYNMDGESVVVDGGFADMWDGYLDAGIVYDERGMPVVPGRWVWTGSNSTGRSPGISFSLGGSAPVFGSVAEMGSFGSWVAAGQQGGGSALSLSLYGFSEELTVPNLIDD